MGAHTVSMVAQKNVLWNCLLVWILASNAFYALAAEDTEVRIRTEAPSPLD